jgi:hypothetical protein
MIDLDSIDVCKTGLYFHKVEVNNSYDMEKHICFRPIRHCDFTNTYYHLAPLSRTIELILDLVDAEAAISSDHMSVYSRFATTVPLCPQPSWRLWLLHL